MSDTTFTPGPWRWTAVEGGWDGVESNHGLICKLSLNVPANARLIAAAPEMFDALADLLWNVEVPAKNCACHIAPPCADCVDYGGLRECVEAGKAAINKALSQEEPK